MASPLGRGWSCCSLPISTQADCPSRHHHGTVNFTTTIILWNYIKIGLPWDNLSGNPIKARVKGGVGGLSGIPANTNLSYDAIAPKHLRTLWLTRLVDVKLCNWRPVLLPLSIFLITSTLTSGVRINFRCLLARKMGLVRSNPYVVHGEQEHTNGPHIRRTLFPSHPVHP